jgi:hypothetical protein
VCRSDKTTQKCYHRHIDTLGVIRSTCTSAIPSNAESQNVGSVTLANANRCTSSLRKAVVSRNVGSTYRIDPERPQMSFRFVQ